MVVCQTCSNRFCKTALATRDYPRSSNLGRRVENLGDWRYYWEWSAPWHHEGRDIGWAEAVAIELVTRMLLSL